MSIYTITGMIWGDDHITPEIMDQQDADDINAAMEIAKDMFRAGALEIEIDEVRRVASISDGDFILHGDNNGDGDCEDAVICKFAKLLT